jgi:hypothetical protein
MYNFYKTGFNYSPNSFIHLAPVALKKQILIEIIEDVEGNKKNITYSEYLNQILDGKNFNITFEDFARQYILNHTESYEFIETISNTIAQELKIDPLNIPNTIVIDNIKNPKLSRLIIKETKERDFVIPCIKYIDNDNKSYFYIVKGSNDVFMDNVVGESPIIYEMVEV